MSRQLPPHPNLDHLKKQAKELLHDSLLLNPAFKLADAQHAIAREYGFASWPKLKAHVDSLSGPAEPIGRKAADGPGELNSGDAPRLEGSSPAGVPVTTNPFAGTWTANLSKSRRHPLNQFQSARLQIEVTGDTLTIDDIFVDDSGHEERGKNTIRVDGDEHRSEHGDGYVLIARWGGSHLLETMARKDGQKAGWGTYEVSADGKALTISGDQQTIVLDRI